MMYYMQSKNNGKIYAFDNRKARDLFIDGHLVSFRKVKAAEVRPLLRFGALQSGKAFPETPDGIYLEYCVACGLPVRVFSSAFEAGRLIYRR